MTALFFSSNNNANGKENGLRNYNDPSTAFRLILGLENAVGDDDRLEKGGRCVTS